LPQSSISIGGVLDGCAGTLEEQPSQLTAMKAPISTAHPVSVIAGLEK
jgi:hypothetical protein